jgi:hypothetical protein
MENETILSLILSTAACSDVGIAYLNDNADRTDLDTIFDWANEASDQYIFESAADSDPQLWLL